MTDKQTGEAMDAGLREKKKKRPARKPRGPISGAALKVLRRVSNGEPLVGTRTFPHPFRYRLGHGTMSDLEEITPAVVANLATLKLIDSPNVSPLANAIRYQITAAGQTLLVKGPPPVEDSQIDWTQDGAA